MLDMLTVVLFIVMGTIGGTAHVLIWAESWNDLTKFSSFKRVVIGGIVGFIYVFLHTDYNFPNVIMTFVAGYTGTDFIQGLAERLKKGK